MSDVSDFTGAFLKTGLLAQLLRSSSKKPRITAYTRTTGRGAQRRRLPGETFGPPFKTKKFRKAMMTYRAPLDDILFAARFRRLREHNIHAPVQGSSDDERIESEHARSSNSQSL